MQSSGADKIPPSQTAPGLAFSLTSTLVGAVSLFLPMCDFDEKYDMSDEISNMILLKVLGHNEFATMDLSISTVAIFVVLGLSPTVFVTGGKLTSTQTAGCTGVTAGVAFVVERTVNFVKMKRDDFPSNQLRVGFIPFTVVGAFMLITSFVVQNAIDRIEAESKAFDFDAVAVYGQGLASEVDQSEP